MGVWAALVTVGDFKICFSRKRKSIAMQKNQASSPKLSTQSYSASPQTHASHALTLSHSNNHKSQRTAMCDISMQNKQTNIYDRGCVFN